MDQLLKEVASNYWCEWNADAKFLFYQFSPHIWTLANRSPYRFLALRAENPLHYERRLAELFSDRDYQDSYTRTKQAWEAYKNPKSTIVSEKYPDLAKKTIAYFSMEYGFDTLKIYSGGLGILSGDHLRGASDIGLKMVGVGLFYLQGYYEQRVTKEGEMLVTYDSMVPPHANVREYLPLEPIKRNGSLDDLVIKIPVGDREVSVRAWRAKVGRVELILLDTNFKANSVHDRHLTRRLYASEKYYEDERRRRIEQEIILGIGGMRMLLEAGYKPDVFHLNEGHVAFAIFEIIRNLMKYGLSFEQAKERAAQIIGFTSHTPVPEGNERFHESLARQKLVPYLDSFVSKQDQETIFNCARNQHDEFDMTKLSLLFSGIFRNGVSRLHGEVCRKMWVYAWGSTYQKPEQVPIDSITNGVHIPYWQSPEIASLVNRVDGPQNISKVADETLWAAHVYRKRRMIVEVRERFALQWLREGRTPEEVQTNIQSILDPHAFIIGFARRFAGYKRVTFFIEDEEKLFSFLERVYRKHGRPVHILFAGKPHPNNVTAHSQIQTIYEVSRRLSRRKEERDFKAQILFIEGYDISIARRLIAGCDIWLNNPIKPLEASGTSGMKAGLNGVLNVSIADGWIAEGIQSGVNGWTFGEGSEASKARDRDELFKLLEETILPVYFKRPEKSFDFSPEWVGMMKNSIRKMMEEFSIERMLTEYIEKMYLPAAQKFETVRR